MMMLNDVDTLEARASTWLQERANMSAPDAAVGKEMDRVRAKYTEGSRLLVDDGALQAYEANVRADFDRATGLEGAAIEQEHARVQRALDAAIGEAEELRSVQAELGTGAQAFLLAGILQALEEQAARTRLAGRTRGQLLAIYQRATDEDDRTLVRTIERAVQAGEWDALSLALDPDHDALTIPQVLAAVRERRRGRVDPTLLAARERVTRLRSLPFVNALEHLKAGRGFAVRPRPLTVTV